MRRAAIFHRETVPMRPTDSPDAALLHRVREALDAWEARVEGPTSSLTGGGAIRGLEHALADRVGVRFGLVMPHGTLALRAGLLALGVEPDTEVICSALDWTAAASAARSMGAHAIAVDVVTDGFVVDADEIAKAINKRTSAVVVTHPAGVPAPIDRIRDVCYSVGVPLLEDVSQALGATARGRPVGGWSDVAICSLGSGKVVDAKEAGALTTDDVAVFRRAVSITQHPTRQLLSGIRPPDLLGLPARMHPVVAMMALYELDGLEETLARRRNAVAKIADQATAIEGVFLPCEPADYRFSWPCVPALVDPSAKPALLRAGLEASPLGCCYLPNLLGQDPESTPNAKANARRAVQLSWTER